MYKKLKLHNINKRNCTIQTFKDGKITKELEYDANSNLIRMYKKGVICSYTYNEKNLPLTLSASNGYNETYEYNDNNLLIHKTVKHENQSDMEHTYYDYDFLNRLIHKRSSTGIIDKYYYLGSTTEVYKHELLGDHGTTPIFSQQFIYEDGQVASYSNSIGKIIKIIYKK